MPTANRQLRTAVRGTVARSCAPPYGAASKDVVVTGLSMMNDRGTTGPSLAVALSAVMWGLWWIPLRALEASGLSGDWASVLLFGGAALVTLPVALLRGHAFHAGGWLLLGIGVISGAAFSAWNHALITGDVVRVSLLFYLAPIWATGFAFFVLGERLRPLRVLSIILGLSGAAVVLGFDGGLPMPRSEGEWMGLASGVLFALAAALSRKQGEAGGFERSVLSFAFSALAAFLFTLFQPLSPPPTGVTLWAAMPLLSGCVLWIIPLTWLLLWGAGRLDPGRVSIILLLEIVTAAVSATILTDEPFGWREMVGCVLILGAGFAEARDQGHDVATKSSIGASS